MATLGRILIVEDDPNDVELTLTALSEYNLANEVVITRDGQQALDYLYCHGEFAGRPDDNPAVMLLDLKLPKVDGLEVLQRIKSGCGQLFEDLSLRILDGDAIGAEPCA